MALTQLEHRQSHALGTGISIGVHAVIAGAVLFFTAIHPPAPVAAPDIPVALLAPNFSRSGSPGRMGGSGMEAGREQPSAAPPRELTPADNPSDARPIEIAVPAMTLDAPTLLPGSAIDIAAVGRGTGPGAGSQRGAGFGREPGVGTGPDSGGSGGDGFGPGDIMTSPQLIREVKPAYTVNAMRAKIQGRVELDVVVLADGTVDPARIRIVQSPDPAFGLDAQAIEAVRQWRFRPGRNRSQQAVPVRVRVELTFTLR